MRHHPSSAMTCTTDLLSFWAKLWHITQKTTVTIVFWFRCQIELPWNSSVLYLNISALSWWPVNVRQRMLPCWTDVFSTSTVPSAHEQRFWGSFLSQQRRKYLVASSHEHKAQLVQGVGDCVISGCEKKLHLPLPKQYTVRGLISSNTQNISRKACHIPDTCS